MVTKFASLATASALLLTAAPAAVAETIIGDVQFSVSTLEGPTFVLGTILQDIEYDAETGIFAEFEADHVQMSIENSYFQGTWFGFHRHQPLGELTSVWTIIIEDHPNYGPMQVELGLILELFVAGPEIYTWSGEFAGAYGPYTGFGEPVSVAGVWSAQVVPAPGVASLLALTGLARRRRRD